MVLNAKQQALLNALLDILIPANPARDIPAAGALGVSEFILQRAQTDEVFAAHLSVVVDRAQEMAQDLSAVHVSKIESEVPEAFNAVLVETYKGYYSRPDMRAKLGVGSHPVHPKGYAVAPESPEFMAELTAPVRARGPVYRDPTGGAA